MRIVHLSDIHFWQYAFNPLRLMSKRLAGMVALLAGRARRFRLAGVPRLVERVRQPRAGPHPDHRRPDDDGAAGRVPGGAAGAGGLAGRPGRVTVIPGNHDRYTWWAHRSRRFEKFFGEFAPRREYPWLRPLDPDTAILGLDPTRAGGHRAGKLPPEQLAAAQRARRGRRPAGRAADRRLPLPGGGPRPITSASWPASG